MLNDPLIVFEPEKHQTQKTTGSSLAASLISSNSPNIVIETIKQAEDGQGLIVRFYESQRQRGEVMVAWKVLSPEARAVFRDALSVDDATWARARGWALSQAVGALSYYTMETNPALVVEARKWLREALASD